MRAAMRTVILGGGPGGSLFRDLAEAAQPVA